MKNSPHQKKESHSPKTDRSSLLHLGTEQTPWMISNKLSKILLSYGLVSSIDESECIAESIVAEMEEQEQQEEKDSFMIQILQEYFSLEDSQKIVATIISETQPQGETIEDDDEDATVESEGMASRSSNDDDDDDDDDDDGEIIGEGECELCERYIRLTKHHLIPRSTWSKMLPKFLHARDFLINNHTTPHQIELNQTRAKLLLGPGLEHWMHDLAATTGSAAIKSTILQRTCLICRSCHSMIHKTHDNGTLATDYNTIEQLLNDEKIYNFCQWANKQKVATHNRI